MPINDLELSDEEFLNSSGSTEVVKEEEEPEEESNENIEEESENQEEITEEEEDDNSEASESDSEDDSNEDDELDEEEENSSQNVYEDSESDEDGEELDSEEEKDDTSDITFDEAKKVFEPFKANGSEVKVNSADEAIKLMQMGANYTKKMQALKPNLKVLKMLEQQDLLSEEKLSFLIDLDKKDPKAISKLLKDAEIDPVDLDSTEEEEEYVPKNYSVPDETIQLEQVLEEISSTPTYSKCIKVIGNQWDSSSKQVLSQNPNLIKQLNEQMQAGIFDTINNEVERIKLFGGLSELSDFDAYKQVGAQLYQAGKLGNKPKPVAKTKVSSKAQDNARTKKRRAASTPKSSSKVTVKKEDFNPLALSDEEFEKLV